MRRQLFVSLNQEIAEALLDLKTVLVEEVRGANGRARPIDALMPSAEALHLSIELLTLYVLSALNLEKIDRPNARRTIDAAEATIQNVLVQMEPGLESIGRRPCLSGIVHRAFRLRNRLDRLTSS
jgi:hypothetical protein